MTQMYELKITATGEVHDAEGNLLNVEPLEQIVVLTEQQAQDFIERQSA